MGKIRTRVFTDGCRNDERTPGSGNERSGESSWGWKGKNVLVFT